MTPYPSKLSPLCSPLGHFFAIYFSISPAFTGCPILLTPRLLAYPWITPPFAHTRLRRVSPVFVVRCSVPHARFGASCGFLFCSRQALPHAMSTRGLVALLSDCTVSKKQPGNRLPQVHAWTVLGKRGERSWWRAGTDAMGQTLPSFVQDARDAGVRLSPE